MSYLRPVRPPTETLALKSRKMSIMDEKMFIDRKNRHNLCYPQMYKNNDAIYFWFHLCELFGILEFFTLHNNVPILFRHFIIVKFCQKVD